MGQRIDGFPFHAILVGSLKTWWRVWFTQGADFLMVLRSEYSLKMGCGKHGVPREGRAPHLLSCPGHLFLAPVRSRSAVASLPRARAWDRALGSSGASVHPTLWPGSWYHPDFERNLGYSGLIMGASPQLDCQLHVGKDREGPIGSSPRVPPTALASLVLRTCGGF